MDISLAANPSKRAAYMKAQTSPAQAEKKADTSVSVRVQDQVIISPEAREAMAKQDAQVDSAVSIDAVDDESSDSSATTTFTTFAEEFSKITQGYSDTIWEHYAQEHEENLTFDSPSTHIWDKYKNPDSPYFRADLSEDERAWAYDQELDLLNGGKHLQMSNPYAFASAGGPPTLACAATQANQACRDQIGQSIQDLFEKNGIDLLEGTSFRLTVDQSDYSIHVSGLQDEELAETIEQALNCGDNGKNLYDHLKLTSPDGKTLGIEYADGRLPAVDSTIDLEDDALAEVKKQAGPIWARYSGGYDPHLESMSEGILNAQPPFDTQEAADRLSAAVRVGAPEVIAQFRAMQGSNHLVINPYAEVDPDCSIACATYVKAYAQTAMDATKTIESYYAEAHKENSSYPFLEGLKHITDKYKLISSPYFRADMSQAERDMAYYQERALLTGSRVTLLDPYALASIGGLTTAQDSHRIALQAVQAKLEELRSQLSGVE